MKTIRKNQLFRRFLVAALLFGGAFNLVAPAMAAGTKPGTGISNTATATYDDDTDPNNGIFNATSNTVTITVAEVAGITLAATGFTDTNGGGILPNDQLWYNYTITNVGNDPTRIFIPATATVAGPGSLTAGASIQYSTNGGQTYTNVPSGGATTSSVDVNGTVLVRVPVTISSTALSGNFVSVVLGDTGNNDNSAGTQNQPDAPDTALAREVRTVDNLDNSGVATETNGVPANGEREASALQSAQVGSLPSMLNGPKDKPDAIATTNNDDFTNSSVIIPPGTNPANAYDSAPVTFTNTVKNTSTENNVIISLLPKPPADKTSLPTGTLVTLTSGTMSAVYRYDGTTFVFVNGTGTSASGEPTATSTAAPISATNPVETAALAAGASANYTVTIDLPSANQLVGYNLPVTAFQDFNNDGLIGFNDANGNTTYDPGEETHPANTTINRLYTGYLKLVKESRLLQGTGPAVSDADGNFSTGTKTPAPGNIIEYRITYTNISTAPIGTNNVTLDANRVTITEDGVKSGTNNNNWATDNDANGTVDTSHVAATAVDTKGSITYNGAATEPATGTEVTVYVDTVAKVAPNESGTFTFQRRVN